MPIEDFSEVQVQMAHLSKAGDSDAEIAGKLRLTAEELGEEWARLAASLKVVSQEESAEIVLSRLLTQAREALKAEDAHYAVVLGSTKEQAILTLNSRGIITAACHNCERILGKSGSELVGKPIDSILTGKAAQVAESADEMQRAEEGDVVESERPHTRSDGGTFVGHHTIVAVIGPTGDTAGFVRTIRTVKGKRLHEIKVAQLEQTIALLLDE
jgi:PAS domain S-box-containing protein